MEVEGARPSERPRKIWLEVIKNNMKGSGLASGAYDVEVDVWSAVEG